LNAGKLISTSFGSFAGNIRKALEAQERDSAASGERNEVDPLSDQQGDAVFQVPAFPEAAKKNDRKGNLPSGAFDIGAILRLRTFLYLIAGTVLFLFQIHNTLTIKGLSRQNEMLREELRISTSISTAQDLKVSELQSIHNVSAYAVSLGLSSSATPPVELGP
jgi:hypothetical protein